MATGLKLVKSPSISTPKIGSYYVRKHPNKWTVYQQEYVDDKVVHTRVSEIAYAELGFRKDWSLEEARARCKILNIQKLVFKKNAMSAAARLQGLRSIDAMLFPKEVVDVFSVRVEQDNEGSAKHLKKVNSHFVKMQELCLELRILPQSYKENEKLICKWFAKNKVSLDYTQKLLALLNRWGQFYSKVNGLSYELVRPVCGISRENIRDAYDGKSGVRKEWKPITPKMLDILRWKLPVHHYNFLFVTVWFGPRPSEITNMKTVEIKKNGANLEFLVVYQAKLNGVEKSRGVKAIPIMFPEQSLDVKALDSRKCKAPTYKRIAKRLVKVTGSMAVAKAS